MNWFSSSSLVGDAAHFAIELDGTIAANFRECSGISATIQVEKWEEGGWNHTPLKYPGRAEFDNLVLKKGITTSSDLFNWFSLVMSGIWARKFLSVILMTPDLQELDRWEFYAAFPVKWTGPTLGTDQTGVAVETLEIAHEGLVGL